MKVLISNISKSDYDIYEKFEAFLTCRDLEIYPNSKKMHVTMRKLV